MKKTKGIRDVFVHLFDSTILPQWEESVKKEFSEENMEIPKMQTIDLKSELIKLLGEENLNGYILFKRVGTDWNFMSQDARLHEVIGVLQLFISQAIANLGKNYNFGWTQTQVTTSFEKKKGENNE